MHSIKIENLSTCVDGKQNLNNLNFTLPKERYMRSRVQMEVVRVRVKVLAGHPDYEVPGGSAKLRHRVFGLSPDEIARLDFSVFQYPIEVPGVSIANFIRAALQSKLEKGENFKAVEY